MRHLAAWDAERYVCATLLIQWTKGAGDVWSGVVPPFAIKVQPKGDGRWTWQVLGDDARNPQASGVASSLGAAKTVTEQFVKRSGRV